MFLLSMARRAAPPPARGATPAPEGLAQDWPRLLAQQAPRRQALHWLGAAAAAGLVGCGGGGGEAGTGSDTLGSGSGSGSGSSGSGSSGGGTSSGTGSCSVIPTETAGPYPGDGSNRNSSGVVNALALSGIVRSDIRTSVGSASGTAPGVPLTVTLTLTDVSSGCTSLAGKAVYLWHCTRDGGYSLYSSGYTGENFLRGVQVSDANGQVSFSTIFPGCYSGRWPHIHFEVYDSLEAATDAGSVSDHLKVSQLALPANICAQVYNNASGYASSVSNLANISLASDNVFSDDQAASQMATVTGDVASGFVASLDVGLS